MLNRTRRDADFVDKIIFSDEAHFHLNGYVNRQNYRIWGQEISRVIVEEPLHSPKVTVWCGFWRDGVIGPFFFESDNGQTVTINSDRYRAMLEKFLWPRLDGQDVDELQQDGAISYTARQTIALLRTKFPDRVISKKGDIKWPPRSPDLSPLDFFLWGFLKDCVYRTAPKILPELKNWIQKVIEDMHDEMCQNVIQNYVRRLCYCVHVAEGHSPDVVFHP